MGDFPLDDVSWTWRAYAECRGTQSYEGTFSSYINKWQKRKRRKERWKYEQKRIKKERKEKRREVKGKQRKWSEKERHICKRRKIGRKSINSWKRQKNNGGKKRNIGKKGKAWAERKDYRSLTDVLFIWSSLLSGFTVNSLLVCVCSEGGLWDITKI